MQLVARLALCMSEEYAEDAAAVLDAAGAEQTIAVLGSLEPAAAAAVLGRLAPARARLVLGALEAEPRAQLLRALEPHQAARVLRAEAPDLRARLLEGLPAAHRARIEKLLFYAEDSAGAALDPDAAAWPEDWSTGQALDSLRGGEVRLAEAGYTLDRDGRLVGRVELETLLAASPESPLSSLARASFPSLRAETSLAVALGHEAWSGAGALPVVDGGGRFMGALRLERLHRWMREMQPEATSAARGEVTSAALAELASVAWRGAIEALTRGGREAGDPGDPFGRGGA